MTTRTLRPAALLFLWACAGTAGDTAPTEDDTWTDDDTDTAPFAALDVQITVSGADGLNPDGDGSGVVSVVAAADGAAAYTVDLGDGTVADSDSGSVEHTYSHEGTETFELTVTASADSGESVTWTGSVTVYRSTGAFPTLVWADEFDGDGALDPEKWHHQVFPPNNGGWYNGEQQHYTDRTDNSYQGDGTLKIVARRESFTAEGTTLGYTSARLNSRFAFTYGRVEVRAKLPAEAGTWPAIWTLGANIDEPGNVFGAEYGSVGWPACGEIDIMEQTGWDKSATLAYFHWGNTKTSAYETEGSSIANPTSTTDFHVYSLEWDAARMVVRVDGSVVHELENTAARPYDDPHYLLLNIAMGGNLGGAIPGDFDEAVMEIDYVRVYQ